MKVWLALIVLWTAAVPAIAQTDSDPSGTGTSHGFTVSNGDTVKFGKQRVRLFGIYAPEKGQLAMMATGITVRWRPRLLSPSSLAARCRVARPTMTTRITDRSRIALLAKTTSRR